VGRTPDGPPPPPVVQRLRIRYAKRDRLRFASHRDFQRAFERAVRRAGVPIASSAGFSPHPRISYAGAAPTGVASEAEYLEIGLTEPQDPEAVRDALDASLPSGLDVLEVVVAAGGALADRLEASRWRVECPGVDPGDAAAAVQAFLDRDEVVVERLTKDGRRRFDARAAVLSFAVIAAETGRHAVTSGSPDDLRAILDLVVRHVTPAVRPDDVLTGVRQVAELMPPPSAVRTTRLAQGPLGDDGRIADPLATDRMAAGAPVAVAGAEPPGAAHPKTCR
jgi:radical SAM-linked protein